MPYRTVIPKRNPHEIVFAAWFGAACLPGALGITPLPPSVQSEAPEYLGRAILIIIAFGCLVTLTGNAWPRPTDRRQTSVTALLIERMGLTITILGSLLYASVLWSFSGWGAAVALGLVLGYSLASGIVAWRITKALNELARMP